MADGSAKHIMVTELQVDAGPIRAAGGASKAKPAPPIPILAYPDKEFYKFDIIVCLTNVENQKLAMVDKKGVKNKHVTTQAEFAKAVREAKWGKVRIIFTPKPSELHKIVISGASAEVRTALKAGLAGRPEVATFLMGTYHYPGALADYPDPMKDTLCYCHRPGDETMMEGTTLSDEEQRRKLSEEGTIIGFAGRSIVFAYDICMASNHLFSAFCEAGVGGDCSRDPTGYTPRLANWLCDGLELLFQALNQVKPQFLQAYQYTRGNAAPAAGKAVLYSKDGKAELYYPRQICERAIRERKAVEKAMADLDAEDPNFRDLITDIRAQFGTPCQACSKLGVKLHWCSRCNTASYCSAACQKLVWPTHKPHCKAYPPSDTIKTQGV